MLYNFNRLFNWFDVPYQIDELFIKSGQRTVFWGKDEFDSKVVIKICFLSTGWVPRLRREIKVINDINSPYFPKLLCYDFITQETIDNFKDNNIIDETFNLTPFFYTVEKFIPNVEWDIVKPNLRNKRNFINFSIKIFESLYILEQKSVVHRDIKPANILINENLDPIIIDFGIAKNYTDKSQNLTESFMGSPNSRKYAAPEQLKNLHHEINYKTDQFSAGLVLYEILSESNPYGDIFIDIEKYLNNLDEELFIPIEQCSIINLPDEMYRIINKLIQAKQYKRFRSCKTVLDSLNKFNEESI